MPIITVGNRSNLGTSRFFDTMKVEGSGMQTWTHTWQKWGEAPSVFDIDTGTVSSVNITMTRSHLDTGCSNTAELVINNVCHNWKLILQNTNHSKYSADGQERPTFDISRSDGEFRYEDHFEDLAIADTPLSA